MPAISRATSLAPLFALHLVAQDGFGRFGGVIGRGGAHVGGGLGLGEAIFASACFVRRAMKSFMRSAASLAICSAWARASATIAAALASASAVFFSKLASSAVASSRSFAACAEFGLDRLAARVERLQDRAMGAERKSGSR